MKHLHRALGIGPLFYTGETPSEEARADLVQVARFLLDDPSFTLPDETTATPEALEDAQETLAVVLFKLREQSMLPYAKLGARRRKRQQKATSQSIKSRRQLADETEGRIVRKALSFRQAGKADRKLSGSIAESLGMSSKHVREVLQERKILSPKKKRT
jgi:hypothetical protein